MKLMLIDAYRFNSWANDLILTAIHEFTSNKNIIVLFKGWTEAQERWTERIKNNSSADVAKWFEGKQEFEVLLARWFSGLNEWLDFWAGFEAGQSIAQIDYLSNQEAKADSALSPGDLVLRFKNYLIFHREQICPGRREKWFTEKPHHEYIC